MNMFDLQKNCMNKGQSLFTEVNLEEILVVK